MPADQTPFRAKTARGDNARWVVITVAIALALAFIPTGWILLQANSSNTKASGQYTPPTPAAIHTPLPGARPVVIDTDMALDDCMAILYLLQRSDIRVEAITVAGTGEAHCEPGVRHARGLLALAGYPQVPVSCGPETPMAGGHSFPDEWRRGVDTLYGFTLPAFADPGIQQSAPELLVALAGQNSGKLSVITLGPLTNVAAALRLDASLAAGMQSVYIMGGAVDVPGNVAISGQGKSFAEWNIYADPRAADVVFSAGLPITLVPLDATNNVPVTEAFLTKLAQRHSTPVADFLYHLIDANRDLTLHDYYFWDTFSAALLTDNSLGAFKTLKLRVVQGGIEDGSTVLDDKAKDVRVAVSADAARFEQMFLDALNGGSN